jgi:hypothetical protein
MTSDVTTEERHEISDTRQELHDSDNDATEEMSKEAELQQESEDRDSSEYWDMDHHKFHWSNYMQAMDPRSWHALGIAVQDSFISKGTTLSLVHHSHQWLNHREPTLYKRKKFE